MKSLRRSDADALLSDHGGELIEAVNSQLSTANLVFSDPDSRAVVPDRQFLNNEEFWRAILSEGLRGRAVVNLRKFSLLEWFPRSPGLYHTSPARRSREAAAGMLHPLRDDQLQKYLRSGLGHMRVYSLQGKEAMLRGGLGCFRLRDKLTEDGRLWFMSASSSIVAHEGIPVGLPDGIYERVIEEIAENGAIVGDLVGRLAFVPEVLNALYSDYSHVPRLYLRVEEFRRGRSWRPVEPNASAAVTFKMRSMSRPSRSQYAVAYVEFTPGSEGDLVNRLSWLERYVEDLHDGLIVTDFDEHMSRFNGAIFSLEKISKGTLDEGQILIAIGFEDFSGLNLSKRIAFVNNLTFRQGQLNAGQINTGRIQMGDGDTFSNIGTGATIVNRSLLNNSLNKVSGNVGEEIAAALMVIAEHVRESKNVEAIENLEGFMEEVERSEPRKSLLKTFWNGLVNVLPSVAQLGEASAKVLELVS